MKQIENVLLETNHTDERETVRLSNVQVFWIHNFTFSCTLLDNPTISLTGSTGVLAITLRLICTDSVVSVRVHSALTSMDTATATSVETTTFFLVPNLDLARTIPSQPTRTLSTTISLLLKALGQLPYNSKLIWQQIKCD